MNGEFLHSLRSSNRQMNALNMTCDKRNFYCDETSSAVEENMDLLQEELNEAHQDRQSTKPKEPSHSMHHTTAMHHHKTVMHQLLVDVWDLHPLLLDDPDAMDSIVRNSLAVSSISVLSHDSHSFSGQGLTLTYILSESHAAVHTWPEHGFAAFDFLTCGMDESDLRKLNNRLRRELEQATRKFQQMHPPNSGYIFGHLAQNPHMDNVTRPQIFVEKKLIV